MPHTTIMLDKEITGRASSDLWEVVFRLHFVCHDTFFRHHAARCLSGCSCQRGMKQPEAITTTTLSSNCRHISTILIAVVNATKSSGLWATPPLSWYVMRFSSSVPHFCCRVGRHQIADECPVAGNPPCIGDMTHFDLGENTTFAQIAPSYLGNVLLTIRFQATSTFVSP